MIFQGGGPYPLFPSGSALETSYDKLAKIYTKYFGHMTKTYTGKNLFKNLLLRIQKADDLGTWYMYVAFGM